MKTKIMGLVYKGFDPARHHRQSTRYKGFDYGSQGFYFITMRTHAFKCLFGEIRNGIMYLNEYGEIVADEWLKAPLIRPYIQLDAFVVMPDHFHGIIGIKPPLVGATSGGATCQVAPTQVAPTQVAPTKHPNGPPPGSIGAILGQFKMQTTKRINALRINPADQGTPKITDKRVWQRNYYDRIIRDEVALQCIRAYIINNPGKAKNKHR